MSFQIELIHIASHSTRYQILQKLKEEEQYTSKLSELLEIDQKVIRFHLTTLHRTGLVEGELKETPQLKGVYMARYWWLTEKGNEILEKLNEMILNLKPKFLSSP